MDKLQSIIDEQLRQAPYLALEAVIEKKLRLLGAHPKKEIISQFTKHILAGNPSPFMWDDGSTHHSNISISITSDDISDIKRLVTNLNDSIPEILEATSTQLSAETLTSLKKKWPKELKLQQREMRDFRLRLEKRWGTGLNKLRMLLTISREIGQNTTQERSIKNSPINSVLTRLHVRACQVTAEIITLLENGFADGAMARWRTLHEISVIMILMRDHGDELAQRYIDHQIIEAKTGMDQYEICHEKLGYEPIGLEEKQKINGDYEEAILKYGRDFRSPYGWAASHISKNRRGTIGFGDLEFAAGKSAMASHYKLASHNVHAGPHALFFRLGLLDDSILLAGASNAGLAEPGQNTAVCLSLITTVLIGADVNMDDLVALKIIQQLSDEIPTDFANAAEALQHEHYAMD